MTGKKVDIVGERFGKLTVMSFDSERSNHKRTYWLCKCNCGNEKEKSVRGDILKQGDTLSCGCLRAGRVGNIDRIRTGLDEIGNKYGRLTIVEILPIINGERISYLCQCECGNEKLKQVERHKLISGNTNSCGCLVTENGYNKRITEGESNFNQLYDAYKCGAKRRKLLFELNKDEFKVLTKDNCYYCGTEPRQIKGRKDSNGPYIYNGIDRIDSSLGYIIENCVSCCGRCNKAKMSEKQNDFINWIDRVYKNLVNKKLI